MPFAPIAHSAPPVICIDAGHPSEVSRGTRGARSTEIQVAYRIAGLLEKRLVHDGFQVVMTKSHEEELVTNRRRAEIANAAHAALFLRLHCDAAKGTGFTVYYPGEQGTSDGVTGPSQEVIARSREAAERFYKAMVKSLDGKLAADGLKTDRHTSVGSKQGALTGSIFSAVPTILVEMVVLTNPKDEDWILSAPGESAMVGALEAGVRAVYPNSARNSSLR